MQASTPDQDDKNSSENNTLLSHSVLPSSPMIEDVPNCNKNGPLRLPTASLLEKEDDDEDDSVKPDFVSFSSRQADSERSLGESNLILSGDGVTNDEDGQGSSFIVNDGKGTSDVGSISEAKMHNETDSNIGVKSTQFCAEMIMLPVGVCQGSTEFAEQMDIFMRCQHPLDILGIFNENEGDNGVDLKHSFAGDVDEDVQAHRPSGYHAIPKSCEYCGSPNIDLCRNIPECERPKSYFPKEIPPFCYKGGSKLENENHPTIMNAVSEDNTTNISDENSKSR